MSLALIPSYVQSHGGSFAASLFQEARVEDTITMAADIEEEEVPSTSDSHFGK
jgi:hypothetical protein